jgi:large subunit ribosomal protein L23
MHPVLRRAAAAGFRRAYATKAPQAPAAARAAAAASAPHKPSYGRRAAKLKPAEPVPPLSAQLVDAAAAKEWEEYSRLNPPAHRRVRGIVGAGENVRAVGHKVYLPNVIIRMVRNFTPVGQAYNPYEATFRVPLSITKTDVRSYLMAVYGVQTTYIRTDVYRSPLLRNQRTSAWNRTLRHRTYKRAVVGLVEPFYYPQALEDMDATAREERHKWLDENFAVDAHKEEQKMQLLRMTRKNSDDWRWRGDVSLKRGNIIKKIMDRRQAREAGIVSAAKELAARRQAGTLSAGA